MDRFYSDTQYKIYVEKYGLGDEPLIIIPGAYHTSLYFSYKPDGTTSWVDYLQKKYTVYVTELPGHGRSGYIPFDHINGRFVVDAYKAFIMQFERPVRILAHSMSGPYVYKMIEELPFGKVTDYIAIEPASIGNIEEVPVITKENEDVILFTFKGIPMECTRKELIPPSQEFITRITQKSERFTQDPKAQAQYKASLQGIHPQLFYERFNLHGSQLKIDDFNKLTAIRNLIVTSPLDTLHCEQDSALVSELQKNGVSVEHIKLDEVGIHGNGHMMMLENNSDEILKLIERWIEGDKP